MEFQTKQIVVKWRQEVYCDMAILGYISALVAAIAFAVLIIFLVKTLKTATTMMERVGNTMEQVEQQVQGITRESEAMLNRSNTIMEDVQTKTESINGFVGSLQNVGESVDNVNHSFRRVADSVSNYSSKQSEQITQVIRWGNAFIDLYARWKKRTK